MQVAAVASAASRTEQFQGVWWGPEVVGAAGLVHPPCRKVSELQEMAQSPRLAAGGGGEVAAATAEVLRGALQMLEQPWVGEGLVQVCRGAVWRQPPAGGGCASTSSLSSLSCLPVAQCWAAPHKLFANQIIIIEHFASGLLTGSSQNICKSGT